jgi:hypothetical protein
MNLRDIKFGAIFEVDGRMYRKVTDNSVFKNAAIIAEIVGSWLDGMPVHFPNGDQLVKLV